MTWQPDTAQAEPIVVGRSSRHHGWRRIGMVMLLAVGLSGLAAAAVGVAYQVLPRQFTPAQRGQIMTWEMTRRWRALPIGRLFPASVGYRIPAQTLEASGAGLELRARRLGVAAQAAPCSLAVSAGAAQVLTAQHCSALLRATYVDSSGSMVVTVGIAVLPDSSVANAAAHRLRAADHGLSFAVRALPVAGTPAALFRDRQRQMSWAMAAGPYVIMSTAGFTDGRRHVPMATDPYYAQEMTSVAEGLAQAAGQLLGGQPPVPTCPGAPGC